MRKVCLTSFLLLAVALTGCTGLPVSNPFFRPDTASSGVQLPSVNSGSESYLAAGSTISAKSERREKFGTFQEDASREQLKLQVIEYQEKLRMEQKAREEAEQQVKSLQKEYGEKLFLLQGDLLKAQKQEQDSRIALSRAETKALAAVQEMEKIRVDMLQKKSLMDSQYPPFYEVRKGDSLWKIAGRSEIYGDPYKWVEIYSANREKLLDPDVLYPGQMLKIPRYFEYLLGTPAGTSEKMADGSPNAAEEVSEGEKDE